MRNRVHLRAPPPIVIPLNHVYSLMAMIYWLIEQSSSEYAAFLHGQGWGEGEVCRRTVEA
jgi:CRISPR/Cas system endoribonuclease Cas6 (RAMP superfamily)